MIIHIIYIVCAKDNGDDNLSEIPLCTVLLHAFSNFYNNKPRCIFLIWLFKWIARKSQILKIALS